jgi:predicted lipoprotein with Yx(FWY)xxD motif
MRKLLTLVATALAASALAASACGATEEAEEATTAPATEAAATPATDEAATPATLTLRKSQFGMILFDGRGRVLYSFTRDRRGKPPTCYGDCAKAWPVYYAPKGALKAGMGVKPSLLKTTKRRDGRLQVTYNGWPLYYYAHEKAGEVKCHNVRTHGGLWLVMRATGKAVS